MFIATLLSIQKSEILFSLKKVYNSTKHANYFLCLGGENMKRLRLEGIVAIFLILSLFGFYHLCHDKNQEGFEVKEDHVADYLKQVTRARYEGHITGSKGNERLRTYLMETINDFDLSPIGGSIESQVFKMMSIVPDPSPQLLLGTEESPETYINLSDYRIMRNPYSGNIDYEGDLIFIKGSITGVKSEDVAGKIVITDLYANQTQSIDIAREKGIRGIIYSVKNDPLNPADRHLGGGKKLSDDLFMVNITYPKFASLEEIAKADGGIIPYGRIKVKDDYPIVSAENIIVTIPGQNPQKEMYFLTHYDGKGQVGDIYYPGASQNGTAMALLLETINQLSDTGYLPEQTIKFVFLDGHEQGNIGVEAFTRDYLDSSKSQEFIVINDLGISNNDDLYLNNSSTSLIPSEEGQLLKDKLAMFAADAGVSVKSFGGSFSSDGIFQGSTADSLGQMGLPVVELKSYDTLRGVAYVYTPSESYDKVDMDKVMSVGNLLMHYIYYEGYNALDTAYLMPIEIFIVYLLISLLIIVSLVTALYKWQPDFSLDVTTVRDFYLSVSFSIFKKMTAILVPTVLMLFIMVFILSIPHSTGTSSLGAGYDNYSLHLHIKHTVHYMRLLIFGGLDALQPTVVEGMLHGGVKSFRLLSVSLTIALGLGVGLGMWNGLKRSHIRTFMGLLVFSIPDVIISLGALYSIVYWFKDSLISPEILRVVVMPTFAMVVVPAIYIARMIEVAVIEERNQPYIYGALARGVSNKGLIWQHIFPKVLSKLFDAMGTVIRIAIINLIVVEYLFSAVGIGNYLMTNYQNAFFVIYISFGFGLMYFILTQFFLLLSWRLNPMKRRLSS